jgi:hypothetical protein
MHTDAPHFPESAKIIQPSLDLSHWLHKNTVLKHKFEDLPKGPKAIEKALKERERHKVAMTLFEIAFEHHTSIVFLCQHHMRTAAFALARCLFDASWQGVWVIYGATPEQVHKYVRGIFFPKAGSSIKPMEKAQNLAPFLSKIYEQAYEALCSYNHGTHLQIQRWIGEDEIAPKHSDEEMREILRLSDQLVLACAVFQADICGADSALITAKFNEVFQLKA